MNEFIVDPSKSPELPLRESERAVWDCLQSLHIAFCVMMQNHGVSYDAEAKEWNHHFHILQGIMEHRMLANQFPGYFTTSSASDENKECAVCKHVSGGAVTLFDKCPSCGQQFRHG